jgi:dTDP-4-dehydrorhamnose reductase
VKILVVGLNSLLSNIFKEHTNLNNVEYTSYKNIKKINFNNFTHVINFCFDPKLKKIKYSKKNDIDFKIIKRINIKTFYISFSTRFVYNLKNPLPFSENDKCYANNYYSKNKLIIEKNITKLCKRHLILRLPTILYFNLKKNNLFCNKMLNTLRKKEKIFFDIDHEVLKDFITEDFFVKNMDILIKKQPVGTFNLSSGIGIKPIEIAKNIIKGYKKGEIIFKKNITNDKSFILSNKKIKKITKININKKQILKFSMILGNKLKHA